MSFFPRCGPKASTGPLLALNSTDIPSIYDPEAEKASLEAKAKALADALPDSVIQASTTVTTDGSSSIFTENLSIQPKSVLIDAEQTWPDEEERNRYVEQGRLVGPRVQEYEQACGIHKINTQAYRWDTVADAEEARTLLNEVNGQLAWSSNWEADGQSSENYRRFHARFPGGIQHSDSDIKRISVEFAFPCESMTAAQFCKELKLSNGNSFDTFTHPASLDRLLESLGGADEARATHHIIPLCINVTEAEVGLGVTMDVCLKHCNGMTADFENLTCATGVRDPRSLVCSNNNDALCQPLLRKGSSLYRIENTRFNSPEARRWTQAKAASAIIAQAVDKYSMIGHADFYSIPRPHDPVTGVVDVDGCIPSDMCQFICLTHARELFTTSVERKCALPVLHEMRLTLADQQKIDIGAFKVAKAAFDQVVEELCEQYSPALFGANIRAPMCLSLTPHYKVGWEDAQRIGQGGVKLCASVDMFFIVAKDFPGVLTEKEYTERIAPLRAMARKTFKEREAIIQRHCGVEAAHQYIRDVASKKGTTKTANEDFHIKTGAKFTHPASYYRQNSAF
jgi:hypothetical protein